MTNERSSLLTTREDASDDASFTSQGTYIDPEFYYYYEEPLFTRCSAFLLKTDLRKRCPWCIARTSWSLLALFFCAWALMDVCHFYMEQPLLVLSSLRQSAYHVHCEHYDDWTGGGSNYSAVIANGTSGELLYRIVEVAGEDWELRLSFRDATTQEEVASIVQTTLRFGRFEIERQGRLWARVAADGSAFNDTLQWAQRKLWVDVLPGDQDYRIVAEDWFGWELRVERVSVFQYPAFAGTIVRERGDNYTVLVEEGEDDVAVLLLSVVIGLVR